jgi:hypothetical protein
MGEASVSPQRSNRSSVLFHSTEGSHNSALMCESLDGFGTRFTRQCAGIGCASCSDVSLLPPGGRNGPSHERKAALGLRTRRGWQAISSTR